MRSTRNTRICLDAVQYAGQYQSPFMAYSPTGRMVRVLSEDREEFLRLFRNIWKKQRFRMTAG